MYIISNEEETKENTNLFDLRENGFTKSDKNFSDMEINFTEDKDNYMNLRNSNKFSEKNESDKNQIMELDDDYIDNNFWGMNSVPSPQNLDFLNDL